MPDLPLTITLTPASSDDAESLVALRILAMRPSLERLGRFDPLRARQRFLANFDPQFTRHIEWESTRVGFVVVRPDFAGLLLDHLYIHPDYQGRGIGAKVLQLVCAEADAAKQSLRVGALRDSDSNRFYLRHGFTLTESAEWDNYYIRLPQPRD